MVVVNLPRSPKEPDPLTSFVRMRKKPGYISWIYGLHLSYVGDRLSIPVASSLMLPPLCVCIEANRRLRRRWTLIPVGPQASTVQEWSTLSSPAISLPEGALTSWSFTARRVPSNKESVPCLHSGVLLTIQTYGSQDQLDPPSMTCSQRTRGGYSTETVMLWHGSGPSMMKS